MDIFVEAIEALEHQCIISVDDSPTVRAYLRSVLSPHCATIEEADNLAAARAKLQAAFGS